MNPARLLLRQTLPAGTRQRQHRLCGTPSSPHLSGADTAAQTPPPLPRIATPAGEAVRQKDEVLGDAAPPPPPPPLTSASADDAARFEVERQLSQSLMAGYQSELEGIGHWSMRRKTEVLERMVSDLHASPGAARHAYLMALWTCSSAGQVRIAESLFSEMDAASWLGVGDTSPFDALLKAQTVCSNPDTSTIRRIWSDLNARGIRPSKRTLELMCRALERTGHSDIAGDILSEAVGEGIEISWDHPTGQPPEGVALLRSCAGGRDTVEAEKVFNEVGPLCPAHWNELLGVYAAAGCLGPAVAELPGDPDRQRCWVYQPGESDPDGLQGVWRRYTAAGGVPDEWAYHHLLQACARSLRRSGPREVKSLAISAFYTAEAAGEAAEQHLWAALMEVFAASGDSASAEELLRQMWERGYAVRRDSPVMHAFEKATSAWLREE